MFAPCNAEPIPLGLYCTKKRFPKSSTNAVFVELFLWLFCRMTRGGKQEKQDISQTET